jgi:hypothetical protein
LVALLGQDCADQADEYGAVGGGSDDVDAVADLGTWESKFLA